MPEISSLEAGYYRVPLPTVLTDSMHGLMRDFEIVTVRLRDKDGAEGTGYTFTVGRNGGAIHDIVKREIAEIIKKNDRMDLEPTMVGPALWRQGRPMKSYRCSSPDQRSPA